MKHKLLIIIFLTNFIGGIRSEGLDRNKICTTPNGESGQCLPLSSCGNKFKAVPTSEEDIPKYTETSQCRYDTEFLVCCASTSFHEKSNEIRTEITLGHLHLAQLSNSTICGIESYSRTSRIIGGTVTELREFPWVAAIEYQTKVGLKNVGIKCGGSLINNRYVLTAAHCLLPIEFEPIAVWLGDWDITSDPDCRTSFDVIECADPVLKLKIETKIPHEFFSHINHNNDIGLIRLERNVHFTDYIRPICLPPDNMTVPSVGDRLVVAGWGNTENGNRSDVKLKVNVKMLTYNDCKNLTKHGHLSPNQLCAGGEPGKDACQGDSGGPLMRRVDGLSDQMQWFQEGVVGWGLGCGRPNLPAIYTRVSRYEQWIIRHMYV